MFGMGLGEILLIAVVAVLFLGPDKLPSTMVQIAKLFRSVKGSVQSAKTTLEEEMRFADLKESAMNYKKELTEASSELERLSSMTEIGSELTSLQNEIKLDTPPPVPSAPKEPEVITFTPKSKKVEPATPQESL